MMENKCSPWLEQSIIRISTCKKYVEYKPFWLCVLGLGFLGGRFYLLLRPSYPHIGWQDTKHQCNPTICMIVHMKVID